MPLRRSAIAPENNTLNVETITDFKQLNNSDAEIQDLTNSTSSNLDLLLPSSPSFGKKFVLLNSEVSTGTISCNAVTIFPKESLELFWNGVKWRNY